MLSLSRPQKAAKKDSTSFVGVGSALDHIESRTVSKSTIGLEVQR
jgi:hypothetical protein